MGTGELEERIEDYISSRRLATIALSRDNKPSAHTVFYINEGLDIYFVSDPLTEKVKTIEVNPAASLTIDDDEKDWTNIKGIQLYGKAEMIPPEKDEELLRVYHDKYPELKELGGVPEHHVFIKVIPDKIYFLDYSKEFGAREILHVEKKSSRIKWG